MLLLLHPWSITPTYMIWGGHAQWLSLKREASQPRRTSLLHSIPDFCVQAFYAADSEQQLHIHLTCRIVVYLLITSSDLLWFTQSFIRRDWPYNIDLFQLSTWASWPCSQSLFFSIDTLLNRSWRNLVIFLPAIMLSHTIVDYTAPYPNPILRRVRRGIVGDASSKYLLSFTHINVNDNSVVNFCQCTRSVQHSRVCLCLPSILWPHSTRFCYSDLSIAPRLPLDCYCL